MAHGSKTGGRISGTPNRRTLDILQRLASLGCDPIEGMARIAMDERNPIEIRARMYAELAGYVAPKRKAIQVDGGEQRRVVFNIGIGPRVSAVQFSDTSVKSLDLRRINGPHDTVLGG